MPETMTHSNMKVTNHIQQTLNRLVIEVSEMPKVTPRKIHTTETPDWTQWTLEATDYFQEFYFAYQLASEGLWCKCVKRGSDLALDFKRVDDMHLPLDQKRLIVGDPRERNAILSLKTDQMDIYAHLYVQRRTYTNGSNVRLRWEDILYMGADGKRWNKMPAYAVFSYSTEDGELPNVPRAKSKIKHFLDKDKMTRKEHLNLFEMQHPELPPICDEAIVAFEEETKDNRKHLEKCIERLEGVHDMQDK